MALICIVFMIMSSVLSKQSLKNETISYCSIVDVLVYERNILNELIMRTNNEKKDNIQERTGMI